MANQISKEKRQVSFVLEKKLVAQLDAEAKRLNLTRTEVVVRACREHLKLDPIGASSSQIDEIKDALVQLAQEQNANQKVILEKIEKQPLPELPKQSGFFQRLLGK